jgi:hypothetical protein
MPLRQVYHCVVRQLRRRTCGLVDLPSSTSILSTTSPSSVHNSSLLAFSTSPGYFTMAEYNVSSSAIAISSEAQDIANESPATAEIATSTTNEAPRSDTTGEVSKYTHLTMDPSCTRNSDESMRQMLVQLIQSPAAIRDPVGAFQVLRYLVIGAQVGSRSHESEGWRNTSNVFAAPLARPTITAGPPDTARDASSNITESSAYHRSRHSSIADNPSYPLDIRQNPCTNHRRNALDTTDPIALPDPPQSAPGRAFGHRRNRSSISDFAFPLNRTATGTSSDHGNSAQSIDDGLQALTTLATALTTIMSYSSQTTAVNSERNSSDDSSDESSPSEDTSG